MSEEITIRAGDMPRVRLFIWELRQLQDSMEEADDQFAERFGRLLDRFTAPGEEPAA